MLLDEDDKSLERGSPLFLAVFWMHFLVFGGSVPQRA